MLLHWLLVLLWLLLLWHTNIHGVDRCLSTLSVLVLQVLCCTLSCGAGVLHAAIVLDRCWCLWLKAWLCLDAWASKRRWVVLRLLLHWLHLRWLWIVRCLACLLWHAILLLHWLQDRKSVV